VIWRTTRVPTGVIPIHIQATCLRFLAKNTRFPGCTATTEKHLSLERQKCIRISPALCTHPQLNKIRSQKKDPISADPAININIYSKTIAGSCHRYQEDPDYLLMEQFRAFAPLLIARAFAGRNPQLKVLGPLESH